MKNLQLAQADNDLSGQFNNVIFPFWITEIWTPARKDHERITKYRASGAGPNMPLTQIC